MLPVHHCWMVESMIPAALRVEEEAFAGDSWNAADFNHFRKRRDGNVTVFESLKVPDNDHIVGFVAYTLNPGFIRIWNMAVRPAYHRQKVGKQIIDYMFKKLHSHKRTRLLLNTRETNLQAQLFFRAMGFKCISIEKRYYDDTEEDGYEMQYLLPGGVAVHAEDEPEHVAQEE